jgi:prevent-host-death family protein
MIPRIAVRPLDKLCDGYHDRYLVQKSAQRRFIMGIAVRDIVAFSEARSNFSRLVEEVRQGAEKIITKNGEPAVALIDAKRLDYYHQLDRDRGHLMLIDEVEKGLADIVAGRTSDAIEDLAERRARSKEKMAALGLKS